MKLQNSPFCAASEGGCQDLNPGVLFQSSSPFHSPTPLSSKILWPFYVFYKHYLWCWNDPFQFISLWPSYSLCFLLLFSLLHNCQNKCAYHCNYPVGLPHIFHCLAQTFKIVTRTSINMLPSHFLLMMEPFSQQPGISAYLSSPSSLPGYKAVPPPGHAWHSQGTAATSLPRQLPKGPL